MRDSVLDAIGSPLVRVPRGGPGTVTAKLESFNPGGSAKARPALYIIRAAEEAGVLGDGDRVVEATSGNTGIGLAMVCAVRGYGFTAVMPSSKSEERRRLMRAYGADLELVEGDMEDAGARADALAEAADAVRVDQFSDPANVRAHYETTGPEVREQVPRAPDALVATVGTGGTITGTGRFLREHYDLEVVGVEPARNPILSTGEPGPDEFQGMGPSFRSDILEVDLLDDVEAVALADAEAECRRLARAGGMLVGQSSGAASLAADRVAERLASDPAVPDDPLVVTVFPDSGERYLTAGTFDGD